MKDKITYLIGILLLLGFSVPGQPPNWGPGNEFDRKHVFKGDWITATEDVNVKEAPLFRKEFKLSKVKKARLYVCGLGYHVLSVNGKPVTDAVLEQAFTRYDKRLLYRSYEVTQLLRSGSNCMAAELGNGWYNFQTQTIWGFDQMPWRKTPRLLLDLVIDFADGTSQTISTDESWKRATGASQFNSLIAGEIYDARKEIPGWQLPGFDDNKWLNAMVTVSLGGILEAQTMPPVKIIRRIKPVAVKHLTSGSWLFDMGQNFAGVVQLKVKGKAGDSVIMRYDESLNKDGSLNRMRNSTQMIDPQQQPEFQTDVYVLKGEGLECYTPRFTYHGFQYVEVKASKGIQLDIGSLEGLFYSTGFETAGSFKSSDSTLNKMHAAALQTYRSNYIGIPTDCPQREKMGWLADGRVGMETGLWSYASAPAYRKWLDDIRDVQLADGKLAGIAPTDRVGYSWIDPKDRDFGPGWGSALTMVTWYLYLYEADTAVVRDNYEAIRKYTEFLVSKSKDGVYQTGIGDWLAPEETPKAITSTALYYTNVSVLSKMAGVIGRSQDSLQYGKLAMKIKKAFNDRYFDAGRKAYRDTTVIALAAPLFAGLVPEQAVKKVAADLALRVIVKDYLPGFGTLGVKYILPALAANGQADVAYRLLTNAEPGGWANSIVNGATTFYEDWKGEFSLNHMWPASFVSWLYMDLAGIQPDERAPGFKHFIIEPVFPKGLQWIEARHMTRYGEIMLSWKRKAKDIELTVIVPKGTSAEIKLPGIHKKLMAGKHKIKF